MPIGGPNLSRVTAIGQRIAHLLLSAAITGGEQQASLLLKRAE